MQNVRSDRDDILTRAQAAAMLGRAVITLRRWGLAGVGPQFQFVGSRPIYRRGDVEDFIARGGVLAGKLKKAQEAEK